MYLEELSKNNASNSEGHNVTINILIEFWGKITPCILQLVSYSKAVSSISRKRKRNHNKFIKLYNLLNLCKLIQVRKKIKRIFYTFPVVRDA